MVFLWLDHLVLRVSEETRWGWRRKVDLTDLFINKTLEHHEKSGTSSQIAHQSKKYTFIKIMAENTTQHDPRLGGSLVSNLTNTIA